MVVFDHGYHGRTNLTMALTAKAMPYKYHFGLSSRRMLSALIADERDPMVLAGFAQGRMRPRSPTCSVPWSGTSPSTTPGCAARCWITSIA